MSSAGEPNPELLKTINKLFGSTLLVTTTDGRTAQGKFICLDRLGNIILEDVVEKRGVTYSATDKEESTYKWETERSLSQAVIRGDILAKVQIAKNEYHRRVKGSTWQELTS